MPIPSSNKDTRTHVTTHDEYPDDNTMVYISGSDKIATKENLVTEYDKYKITQGKCFYISGFETIASGNNLFISAHVANSGIYPKIVFNIDATSQTELVVYEGSTFTNGTEVSVFNKDRSSSNTSIMNISRDVSISNSGSAIFSASKGLIGTPVQKSDNLSFGCDGGVVFNKNSNYLFKITSKSEDNIVSYYASWNEA